MYVQTLLIKAVLFMLIGNIKPCDPQEINIIIIIINQNSFFLFIKAFSVPRSTLTSFSNQARSTLVRGVNRNQSL